MSTSHNLNTGPYSYYGDPSDGDANPAQFNMHVVGDHMGTDPDDYSSIGMIYSYMMSRALPPSTGSPEVPSNNEDDPLLRLFDYGASDTLEEIAEAKAVKMEDLKDPQKDEDRAKNPEWLVMLGVCTHLGCVPLNDKGDYNGWFCPCHGSHYDTSGRIRKGPAPTNMEVPKYEFVNANTIKIG